MRDQWLDTAFEAELREAMRLELATVHVGVAAPQVRGRIAARERDRRTMRLLLLAAGLAAALLGGLVLAGRFLPAPPPAGAEPATVAAIDATSGDLVLLRAWPDGRTEETARYPGALDRLREATGDPTATTLPLDAVASLGPDGWFAVALPGDDVLYFGDPDRATGSLSGALGADSAPGWIGWNDDGRLVLLGEAPSGPRLVARLFDPATGIETTLALPDRVVADWGRGDVQRITWTGDGTIVAMRSDASSFESTLGTLDLGVEPVTFVPGLPEDVRAITGLEPRYAADGSSPGSACQDETLATRCAGVEDWSTSQAIAPRATWYVGRADEALSETVRTAAGDGLLVVARTMGAEGGRVIVVDAPGSWRDGFAFAAPAYEVTSQGSTPAGEAYVVGVAPGGRAVAVLAPDGLVVGDVETGQGAQLPAGTVFVGWPAVPTIATTSLPTIPACGPATTADGADVALSAAGVTSPASSGVRPVVGGRQDADPLRRAELASAPVTEAEPGGFLVLALPPGTCAEAAISSATPATGAPAGESVKLGVWSAGHGTVAGLLPVVAPPPGDWVVRVELWLDGADREVILLYRVRTAAP